VEAALTEALGESATVSRSTVSRICTEIKTQFQQWSARRLDDVSLDYLFLDGSPFKYHGTATADPVRAAWGIDTDGKPVFLGLEAASSESGDAWEGFLAGLGERGLACPLLGISDGAGGLGGVIERTMGAALRQRCLIDRERNELTLACCGVDDALGVGESLVGGCRRVAVLSQGGADFADDVADGSAVDGEQFVEGFLAA